ncbi:MAG: DUF2934 domain-containing protein [Candidatus Sulfotelmatobacter sp.]
MTRKSQPGKIQSVLVVEADILDRMNETDASIAQRAYEIYQSRGSKHGADQDDWFTAEQEILRPLSIERYVTDNALRLTAQLPGLLRKTWKCPLGIDGPLFAVSIPIQIRRQTPAVRTERLCGLSSSPLMSIRYWRGQRSKAESCKSYCRAHGKQVFPDSKRATSRSTS